MLIISTSPTSPRSNSTVEQPKDDKKQLPSTVTLLVSPEQSKILAELEADGKPHLSLVYRGSRENAAKFLASQDKALKALYPAPAENMAKEKTAAAGNTGIAAPGTESPSERKGE